MKKIIAALLTIACLAMLVIPASAEDYTNDEQNKFTIPVTGYAMPTTLAATVTMTGAFAIDPNKNDATSFVSPSYSVSNDCYAPLAYSWVSMTAKAGSPAVVKADTYTDAEWMGLSVADSKKSIAFGIVPDSGAAAFYTPTGVQPIMDIAPQADKSFTMCAKFGRAWKERGDMEYEFVSRIDLVE